MNRVVKIIVGGVVTIALSAGGGVAAHAAEPAPAPRSQAAGPLISTQQLNAEGWSDEQIRETVEASPSLSLVTLPVPPSNSVGVATRGVELGTYIRVTMSQATAKAINAGSAATAVALLALAGPLAAVIAAAVYATIASYNDSQLSRCKTWAFSYTYLGQLVRAECA